MPLDLAQHVTNGEAAGIKFADKLDLFMKLTQTTNRALGAVLMIDPSQVSRVRNGRRRPTGAFLDGEKMAEYFAGRLREDYQFHALEKAMALPYSLPKEGEELMPVLTGILREQAGAPDGAAAPAQINDGEIHQDLELFAEEIRVQVFSGPRGNEAAKLTFLGEVVAMDTPKTICLFNTDDMVWMKEDSAIARQVNALTQQIYARGHRVIVIFNIDRNYQQMQALVDAWLPLLLERFVEVYYYPGKVDSLFRRHISVVAGALGLTSSSVGDMNSDKITMILREKKTIRALQKEFDQLLHLSKPLFNIYQADNEMQMMEDIGRISKEEAPTFRYVDPLPVNTMPEHVFESVFQRMHYRHKERVGRQYKEIYRFNEWNLHRVPVMEMLRLPDPGDVRAGRIPVEPSLYFPMDTVYYTPGEYAAQLHHIIALLQKHENYHLHVTEDAGPANHLLLIKRGMHVMAASKKYPPMIMTTREPVIVDLFWDHYMEKTNLDKSTPVQKRQVIRILEQYLAQLQSE